MLQPDYSTTGVDFKNYDPPRNLSSLLPGTEVDHVFLNKLTTYKQLKELKKKGYDIFVNLCEGYLEWEVPSIDAIHTFEILDLPHTGPTAKLYDPPKELMKYVAYCEGVRTPGYIIVETLKDLDKASRLNYPLFIKPAKAGDSLGIDEDSVLYSKKDLLRKAREIFDEYGPLIVEEFIPGREFTVLVAANADGKTCSVFKPVEYVFPNGRTFKTYALKTSELHPDCNRPCTDPLLEEKLKQATEKIFKGFNGVGYARLDFRVNEDGDIFFLEINFTCSVFYKDGYEGSADFILKFDEVGQAGFLHHIISEGIARHQRNRKPYRMKGDSISGFGIYATRDIKEGETIFTGEERSHRIVTRRFVEMNWSDDEKLHFRRYAYALSEEVFALWDENPSEWAPQNHSCDANTCLDGLNVIAVRNIRKNEELTLDYAVFLDDSMEPFECRCGCRSCRGMISGTPNNSVNQREQKLFVINGQ